MARLVGEMSRKAGAGKTENKSEGLCITVLWGQSSVAVPVRHHLSRGGRRTVILPVCSEVVIMERPGFGRQSAWCEADPGNKVASIVAALERGGKSYVVTMVIVYSNSQEVK